MDFVRFTTSFRAIKNLDLSSISYAHLGVPPGMLQSPCDLSAMESLYLYNMDKDGGQFFELSTNWFSSRGNVPHSLKVDNTVFSHLSGSLLFQSVNTHLQFLRLLFHPELPPEDSQMLWRRAIRE